MCQGLASLVCKPFFVGNSQGRRAVEAVFRDGYIFYSTGHSSCRYRNAPWGRAFPSGGGGADRHLGQSQNASDRSAFQAIERILLCRCCGNAGLWQDRWRAIPWGRGYFPSEEKSRLLTNENMYIWIMTFVIPVCFSIF